MARGVIVPGRSWLSLGRLEPRQDDLLVLQSKQADVSVLAPYATSPSPPHQGQRVVEVQRLMQTVSDPFLGWTTKAHQEHLYWRHFRDWKGSLQLEQLNAEGLDHDGKLCAASLAKAHARCGADGEAYADQCRRDHQRLLDVLAIGAGSGAGC